MTSTSQPTNDAASGLGLAILRIALGVTVLATWWGNVGDDFYSADGLRGFFDWAFTPAEEGGNGSSLGIVESIIDGTVLQAPGLFGFLQTVMELLIGLGLLFGVFTRFFGFLAVLFFGGLFLTYFGGEEWIWTYVILMAGALAVFLGRAGRTLGVDQVLAVRGPSSLRMLW